MSIHTLKPQTLSQWEGKQKIDDGWKMASSWEPFVDRCCLFSVELLHNPQTRPPQLPHWNVDWPSAQQRSVAADPFQLRKWIRSNYSHHAPPVSYHVISYTYQTTIVAQSNAAVWVAGLRLHDSTLFCNHWHLTFIKLSQNWHMIPEITREPEYLQK